ncbi:RHS repeat-associated core domain-containing protein [Acidovorax facilis]|uniref:RHS repeat-associated core domain-containing protein n=1 Tax=Acidovorax facilis TaxID=12917 RepID=UPI003CE692C4
MFKTEPLYSSTPASGSSNKNLNNLLADDDDEPQAEPPGLIQQILSFFSKLWSPSTSDAEKLGFSYVYAEDGSLLGEYGSGGTNSSGTAQYIYLPTASGPLPIAAVIKGTAYAIHSDHLNTPRKLTQADGQTAWQWAYSAFGDEQPTIGAKRFTNEMTNPTTGATSIPEVTFNLRYPGQYFDKETKLHYNHFRSYSPTMGGRYTQGDPIGLDGGWNRFAYVGGNPLKWTDPKGLAIPVAVIACMTNPLCAAAAGGVIITTANACKQTWDYLSENWMSSSSSSNPMIGEPGCEVECNNKRGNRKQTRRYGPDGFPETDTDWDHWHEGLGPPHSHDWTRPADGSRPNHGDRGNGRPSVPGDPGIPK